MCVSDDDMLMLSALEHYAYCPRQFALIHMEGVWEENVFTLKGTRIHEALDVPSVETRASLRVVRALPVWSDRLGISGRCDVVEFLPDGTPYPVEAKPCRTARRICHDIQVCAEGICLEEMFGTPVQAGAVFYYGSRRRREVAFAPPLRQAVETAVTNIRKLMRDRKLPPPANDRRCRACSLVDACVPEVLRAATNSRYDRDLYCPPLE